MIFRIVSITSVVSKILKRPVQDDLGFPVNRLDHLKTSWWLIQANYHEHRVNNDKNDKGGEKAAIRCSDVYACIFSSQPRPFEKHFGDCFPMVNSCILILIMLCVFLVYASIDCSIYKVRDFWTTFKNFDVGLFSFTAIPISLWAFSFEKSDKI